MAAETAGRAIMFVDIQDRSFGEPPSRPPMPQSTDDELERGMYFVFGTALALPFGITVWLLLAATAAYAAEWTSWIRPLLWSAALCAAVGAVILLAFTVNHIRRLLDSIGPFA